MSLFYQNTQKKFHNVFCGESQAITSKCKSYHINVLREAPFSFFMWVKC